MTTYSDSGVDVPRGDRASASAYRHAASTFASRKGLIGEPVYEENGYAGFLDMGDYFLVQSDDSTGSKIDIAFEAGKFDTLGFDLTAMVADDAVCTGAEPISITNTLDVPKIDPNVIDALMAGLAKACREQKIVIPGGEIAEVPGAVAKAVWSATVVGVVEKTKVLKPESIAEGDSIIALRCGVARSNGFSLIRKILTDALGKDWVKQEWKHGMTWGEIVLTPSIIFTDAVLSLIGRFREKRPVNVKGIAHITGGGIPSKLRRILRTSGRGAELTDLWPPHEALVDLIRIGAVPLTDAFRTWHMGSGMLIVVPPSEETKALKLLKAKGIEAQHAGVITKAPEIVIKAWNGEELKFEG